jgi:hypothetical protein
VIYCREGKSALVSVIVVKEVGVCSNYTMKIILLFESIFLQEAIDPY